MRELLLPLLLLPLLTPALVAAEATAGLFNDPPTLAAVWWESWPRLILYF